MTARASYLDWKRSNNAVGCRFARLMAVRADDFGQRIETVNRKSPMSVAKAIDACVVAHIANPEVIALTVLLPKVLALADLVDVAVALRAFPDWIVTPWHEPTAPGGAVVAFGVAHNIPMAGGASVPSEVLALGPFAAFPATRNAPVTALEIFVGTPLVCDPKKGTPTTKANLAHVPVMPPLSDQQHDQVWKRSVSGRLASLGGVDDCRAKAKVAFVVPLALAKSKGCAP